MHSQRSGIHWSLDSYAECYECDVRRNVDIKKLEEGEEEQIARVRDMFSELLSLSHSLYPPLLFNSSSPSLLPGCYSPTDLSSCGLYQCAGHHCHHRDGYQNSGGSGSFCSTWPSICRVPHSGGRIIQFRYQHLHDNLQAVVQ